MLNNLSNIFLMTDVDGTLLDDSHKISERNIDAIRELKNCSGKFTIATGRGVSMALPIVKELELTEPAVIFNGAAIYDFTKNKYLWTSELSVKAYDYILKLHKEFPTMAVEVLQEDKVYVLYMNELERKHLNMGNVEPIICGIDEIPKNGWIKSLFVDEPENIEKIIKYAQKHCIEDVYWVRSSPFYYEMLPVGVNKGFGFKKLLELINDTKRYIVTAGDFMNDLEMIRMADLGVAVENAQECVKKAADLIVKSNNNDAIYEIVQYLKRNRKVMKNG